MPPTVRDMWLRYTVLEARRQALLEGDAGAPNPDARYLRVVQEQGALRKAMGEDCFWRLVDESR